MTCGRGIHNSITHRFCFCHYCYFGNVRYKSEHQKRHKHRLLFLLLVVLLLWYHMGLFMPLQSASIVVIVVIGVVVSVIVDMRPSFVKEAMTTITLLTQLLNNIVTNSYDINVPMPY